MVGLVLDRPREQLGALDPHRIAVHVEAAGHHRQRPDAVVGQLRERQASLRAVLELRGQVQGRVDQVPDLAVDVPGEDPQPDADLRRGEAGAGCLEHRVGEVGDQLPELAVEVDHLDRPACGGRDRRTGGWVGWPRRESSGAEVADVPATRPLRSTLRVNRERGLPRAVRVDLDPDGIELAGRPHPLQLAERRGQRRALRPRHPDDGSLLVVGGARQRRQRAEYVGIRGQLEQRQRVVERAGCAPERRDPGRRWQSGLAAFAGLAYGEPGLVPPHQRLQRGGGRLADGERPAAGAQQRDRVGPAAQRLLRGPHAVASEQQPGVEEYDDGVPLRRHRLGTGRRDHDPALTVDLGAHPVAAGGDHRDRRERAAELVGGAGVADHRRPQPAPTALGARPAGCLGAAPATARRRRRTGELQRAGAGRAPGRGAAPLAGQPQDVAGPRASAPAPGRARGPTAPRRAPPWAPGRRRSRDRGR